MGCGGGLMVCVARLFRFRTVAVRRNSSRAPVRPLSLSLTIERMLLASPNSLSIFLRAPLEAALSLGLHQSAGRCRGTGRDGSPRRSSGAEPCPPDPGRGTSGRPGSSLPPGTSAAPSGSNSHSRQSASAPSARDRPMASRAGCNGPSSRRAAGSSPMPHRSGGSQMIARNHVFEIEFIKKTVLPTHRLTHHRPDLLAQTSLTRNHDDPSPSKDFFNRLGYKQTCNGPKLRSVLPPATDIRDKVLDRRQDDAATPRAKSYIWPSAPCGPGAATSALRIAPTASSVAGACPRGD